MFPSPPPMTMSPRVQRYTSWPYYIPPYMWSVDPDRAPPSGIDWTCAVAPDPAQYHATLAAIAELLASRSRNDMPYLRPVPKFDRAPRVEETLERLREAHRSLASGPDQQLDIDPKLPMFARIPPAGRLDPAYVAYRFAQRMYRESPFPPPSHALHTNAKLRAETASDLKNPRMHPVFAFTDTYTPPELSWDLSPSPSPSPSPPSLPSLALTPSIPLFPEEFATPITHPPLALMRLRLSPLPSLELFLTPEEPAGGLVIEDVLLRLSSGLAAPLTRGEYDALTAEERRVVLRGWSARTGGVVREDECYRALGGEEGGESGYVVADALGGRTGFWGFQQVEEGNPWDWVLRTDVWRGGPAKEGGEKKEGGKEKEGGGRNGKKRS
ncbi:hypothetical protein PLICRDRAFT_42636, partial [Plicaturopsis crispa FD-325 SS-3]